MTTIYKSDGTELLSVEVDSTSYAYREIMGDTRLMLYFALAEYIEIPLGSWCEFEDETYTLIYPSGVTVQHRRNYEYTLEMRPADAVLAFYKFREINYSEVTGEYGGDARLKFSLTATPREHLAMVVANLNQRTSDGWSIGECIDSSEIVVTYSHVSVLDALKSIANECDTEYEIVGRVISLRKVEYYKETPLPLSYGKGNGLKPGIQRTNRDSQGAIGTLFVEGGDRNIDRSRYGAGELHLPAGQTLSYDGEHFEDEAGFDSGNARTYTADADGWGLTRTSPASTSGVEASVDLSDVYPTEEHTVLTVVTVNAEKNWYNVVIDAPESLDYRDCQIADEVATVVFQSGMLTGKEFDIETNDSGVLSIEKFLYNDEFQGWSIPLKPEVIDDVTMPGGVWLPAAGDTLKVFGIQLPDEYIADNDTKSGAEWELFRKAVKYMYDNEEQAFTLKAELDGIWAKSVWETVSPYLRCGAYILYTDPAIQSSGELIRITAVKTYVNNPHSPEITLSNETTQPSIAAALREIDNSRYDSEQLYRQSVGYTRRRFRDATETIEALAAAVQGFDSSIKPVAVQTMAALIGDESMQFDLFDDEENPAGFAWNSERKQFFVESDYLNLNLRHMTLGITDISSSHDDSEHPQWVMNIFASNVLTDGTKIYYLYAEVDSSDTTAIGTFYLSETVVGMYDQPGYYTLLVGILNAEDSSGERAFSPVYGFTEILPGRIITERIISGDGQSYLDLRGNKFHLGSAGSDAAFDWNNEEEGALSLLNGTIVSKNADGDEMYRLNGSDGSGHVAGRALSWDKYGVPTLRIDGMGISLNGSNSQFSDLVLIVAKLNSLFTREGSGTADDPFVIRANYGFYSTGGISAYGKGTGGDGGDGGTGGDGDVTASGTLSSEYVIIGAGSKTISASGVKISQTTFQNSTDYLVSGKAIADYISNNTVQTSSSALTSDYIILGAGSKTIKTSTYGIESELSGGSDMVPTSSAVQSYIESLDIGGNSSGEWYNIYCTVNGDDVYTTIENINSTITNNSSEYRLVLLKFRKQQWRMPMYPYELYNNGGCRELPPNNISEANSWWPITSGTTQWFVRTGASLPQVISMSETHSTDSSKRCWSNTRNKKMRVGVAVFKNTGEGKIGWHRISNIAYVELYKRDIAGSYLVSIMP